MRIFRLGFVVVLFSLAVWACSDFSERIHTNSTDKQTTHQALGAGSASSGSTTARKTRDNQTSDEGIPLNMQPRPIGPAYRIKDGEALKSTKGASAGTGNNAADQTPVYRATNAASGLEVAFDRQGATIEGADLFDKTKNPDWSLRVEPQSYGVVGAEKSVQKATDLETRNRRVELNRPRLREYYVNEPRGLKHGFIAEKPDGFDGDAEMLALEVSFDSSDLRVRPKGQGAVVFVGPDGDSVLKYADLVVRDNRGQRLEADLRVDGKNGAFFRVKVGSGIDFPIEIDPVFRSKDQGLSARNSFGVRTADLDGDGDQDLAIANKYEQNRVWENDGDANFSPFESPPQALTGQRGETEAIPVGDIDNDSDIDLVGMDGGMGPSVFLNDSNGKFTYTSHYQEAIWPEDQELADLDGDDNLDIVVAGSKGIGSRIYRYADDGSIDRFVPGSPQTFLHETNQGVTPADLDGDGDLDLAFAIKGAPDAVWKNDGDGNFSRFESSPQELGRAWNWSLDVEAGDLDGDGDQDLFVAKGDGGCSSVNDCGNRVWENRGDGTFDSFRGCPYNTFSCPSDARDPQMLGSRRTTELALEDLDKDGDPDAFAVNALGDPTAIWENQGDGIFEVNSSELSGSGDSQAVDIGDLDGDGNPDGVVANASGDPNRIWINRYPLGINVRPAHGISIEEGSGNTGRFQVSLGTKPQANVVLGFESTNANQATVSPSSHTFTPSNWDVPKTVNIKPVDEPYVDGASHIVIDVSMKSSADPDYASIDPDDAQVTIENDDTTQFNFVDTGQSLGEYSTRALVPADVNNDGKMDFVSGVKNTGWVSTAGANRVYLNRGKGIFEEYAQSFGADSRTTRRIDVADVNGDGNVDVFAPNSADSGQVDKLFLGDGKGGFSASSQSFGSHNSKAARLEDLNGDGAEDLVVVTKGGNRDYRWINDGDGKFQSKKALGGHSTTNASDLVVLDVDQDGNPDLFISDKGSHSDHVLYLGDGAGGFPTRKNVPDKESASSVAAVSADFNSDGYSDVAAIEKYARSRILLSNQTNALEDTGFPFGEAISNVDAAVGDLNGNGKDEVFVVNEWTTSRIFVGDGRGGLGDSGARIKDSGLWGSSVALGDFDGDGDLDAVISRRAGYSNLFFRNNDRPDVVADAPDVVNKGEAIQLNASGTSDDGPYSKLSFRWRLMTDPSNGSDAIVSETSGVTSLSPSETGEYEFQVTVEDAAGFGATETVSVLVNAKPTVSLAQTSYSLQTGETVTFDASGSVDPDGDKLDFDWTVEPPSGFGTASYELKSDSSAEPKFTANEAGTFEATVEVSDGRGGSVEGTITVEVNHTPDVELEAGTDLVNVGESIQFDGSGSSDVDGSVDTYNWSIVSGPTGHGLNLAGQSGATATVTPTTPGSYTVELEVVDDKGGRASRTVDFEVNGEPSVSIQAPSSAVELGDNVSLSAEADDDRSRARDMDYEWSFVKTPSGSQVSFRTTSGRYTGFMASTAGTYTVEVEATDEHGLSATASADVVLNTPPEAAIKQIKPVIQLGSAVPLKAQASSDAEDAVNKLEFTWTILDKPPTSSAQIADASKMTTQIKPDVSGLYRVELQVRDTAGSTATAKASFRGNKVPKAVIERDKIEVNAGESFQIDATESGDEESHQSDLTANWEFVQTPQSAGQLPELEGFVPSLKLDTSGKYVLELTLTDGAGATHSDTVEIAVNAGPSFIDPTPTESIKIVAGEKVEFDVATEDPEGDQVSTSLVDGPSDAKLTGGKVVWDSSIEGADADHFVLEATDGNATTEHTVGIDIQSTSFGVTGAEACEGIECGDGEVCHLGGCHPACSEGGTCQTEGSVCLDGTRCASDACERIDCKDGYSCYRGNCFQTCEDSCPDSDHKCIEGRCTPSACADVECPSGQTCYQGSCFRPCENDDQCEGRNRCVDGRCTAEPCDGVQCPDSQTCYQGSCFGSCETSEDCEGDTQCVEGACTNPCKGVDCPADQTCYQGQCMSDDEAEQAKDEDSGSQEGSEDANRSSGGCGCDTGNQPPAGGLALILGVLTLIGATRRFRWDS